MASLRRWMLAAGVFACGTAAVAALRPPASAAPPLTLPVAGAGLPIERPLPALVLRDDTGVSVAFDTLRGKPTWLLFFRGVYCPSCRAQLEALAARAAAVESSGVELIAISPDQPEALARLRAELGLKFRLLSDSNETAVTALCAGLAHCQLLVDRDGVVRWGAFSESWSVAT
ncbi:MAG: redoxin domain-containing protein, partial [Polyangiaceae bacterium]